MKSMFTLLATTAVAAATTWSGRATSPQEPASTRPPQQEALDPAVLRPATAPFSATALTAEGLKFELPAFSVEIPAFEIPALEIPALELQRFQTPVLAEIPLAFGAQQVDERAEELARLRKRLAELEEELARREGPIIRDYSAPRDLANDAQERARRDFYERGRELAERERARAEEAREQAAEAQKHALDMARQAERARSEAMELRERVLADAEAVRAEARRAMREADSARTVFGRAQGLGPSSAQPPLIARAVAPRPPAEPAPPVPSTAPVAPVAPVAHMPPAETTLPAPTAPWVPALPAAPSAHAPAANSIHIHVERGDVHIHQSGGGTELRVEGRAASPGAPRAGAAPSKPKRDKDRVSLGELDVRYRSIRPNALPTAVALAHGEGLFAARGAALTLAPEAAEDELLRLVREVHADILDLRNELRALRGEVDAAPPRQGGR